MKQKKKKAVGSEMRFGVNTTAPFVGMKREEGAEYPFAKQVISNTVRVEVFDYTVGCGCSKHVSKRIPLSLSTAVRSSCGYALQQQLWSWFMYCCVLLEMTKYVIPWVRRIDCVDCPPVYHGYGT